MADIPENLVRRTGWPISVSRAVATPIQPSVVYASESPDQLDAQYQGDLKGYTYAREGHPNADVLARKIDALEGAEGGLILGSGMAAVTAALLGVLQAGDHVLGGDQLYGRSLAPDDAGPGAVRHRHLAGRSDRCCGDGGRDPP